MSQNRCKWCGDDELYIKYHDEEWGVPIHDDRKLFEFLVLESAQAGLSWITILKRRENYRKAFANFDVNTVAEFGDNEKNILMNNAGIIRNKQKIEATVNNAIQFQRVVDEFGSFAKYFWDYVDGKPIINKFKSDSQIPAKTAISELISKDMKKRGFSFFGPTICYAHMQATGLVNDHVFDCFRYGELQG